MEGGEGGGREGIFLKSRKVFSSARPSNELRSTVFEITIFENVQIDTQ